MNSKQPVILFISLFVCCICNGQAFDTSLYQVQVDSSTGMNHFFMNDSIWRGADGAGSIDLENGKVLWLFSDGFICSDTSGSRNKSIIIRNSIAIQDGYDLKNTSLQFYWDKSKKKPDAFFRTTDQSWYWLGHGVMIKNKLLIFLMKERSVNTGLGFETFGWSAVLISNPTAKPSKWKMTYLKTPETYGTVAGSAAVLKDDKYMYAYSAVEPGNHEVYLLRWKLSAAYTGNLANPQWWLNGKWTGRKKQNPIPAPLFIGGTEFSVHYDTALKKYIQVQSFGFGEAKIGLRMSDSLQGKWTEPYLFYTPDYNGAKRPFMYAAKAHPELHGSGIYITYNINSFDFDELLKNQSIYFPRTIRINIIRKK